MRPPECLLGSGRSEADTYDRRRKDPHFIVPGECKFHRGLEMRGGRKGSGWILESLCELYAVRVARTVTRGVCVYTCSVVLRPTHPICSMIYGSTGATHFDQLAKILNRIRNLWIPIQDHCSSFSGSCSVVTQLPAYKSNSLCSVVTQDKHTARLLAGRIKVIFRSTFNPVKCKKHSRITQRTLLVCFLLTRKERRATGFSSDLTICSMGADSPKNPWEQ
uniref:Uncharacterized protein n=1 Tax=Solanum lycopersicum TaxID=4081 RepID=K4BH96_SOLLC